MSKTKTVKIVVYMPFQCKGWGANAWYRNKTLLNDVYADKNDAMDKALSVAKDAGFTHALILEDHGRLNQKPYKLKLQGDTI